MKRIFLIQLLMVCVLGANAQKVTRVAGVSITVQDMEREIAFFEQVLDFKKIQDETLQGEAVRLLYDLASPNPQVRAVTLELGQEQIRLLDFDPVVKSSPLQQAFNADTRGNDRWFQHLAIVVSNMDTAYQRLLLHKVTHVSTAPQTLPHYLPNAAGIRAFYFRDPEGHNLELIWFPADKGDPKWKAASSGSLFLGIDHTAISIADTDTGMAFYRDLLGLVHGGHSENYGPEQEHLNQVFGARLDINGLHAEAGFGVEFLRYIAPPGGRGYPPNSKPADLWHYQTEFIVDDLDGMAVKLMRAGYQAVSTTPALVSDTRQWLFRDPDGHAVLFCQDKR